MKPHPVLSNKPPELQGLLYDFWWDIEKLHALKLPTQTILVKNLLRHLDLPYWKHNDKPFQITPRQVMESPSDYPEQYARTCDADLRYPIIVREDDGGILILDGVHRLLKAFMETHQEIKASVFSDELIPLILHDEKTN